MTHPIIGQHIRIKELEEEGEALRRRLSTLAHALFQKHFASVEPYVTGDVTWAVFTDSHSILSQIDNMTAGLTRVPIEVQKDATRLNTLLTALVNAEANNAWLNALNQASATASPGGIEAVKQAIDYTTKTLGAPYIPPVEESPEPSATI